MKRDYTLYLKNIIKKPFDKIEESIQGMSFHEFIADGKTSSVYRRKIKVLFWYT